MLFCGLRSVVICCLVLVLVSCQKELDEKGYPSCLPEKVEVFYGSGSVAAETYTYHYNPATLQYAGLDISIPALGFSQSAVLTVSGNSIIAGGFAQIVLDGSKRISGLKVSAPYPGSYRGDYFYGYNSSGFLEERLFDDGFQLPERTVFAHDGSGLTTYSKQYDVQPARVNGALYYASETNVAEHALLPYGDIFPELVPFFPMVKLGKISPYLLERVTEITLQPLAPPLTAGYYYDGYAGNNAGALQAFESKKEVNGRPAVTKRYRITYSCR